MDKAMRRSRYLRLSILAPHPMPSASICPIGFCRSCAPIWAVPPSMWPLPAPVFLRANIARITRQDLLAKLSEEGVAAEPDAASPTAIRLTGTPRGLTALPSFKDGLWELQDAGSQALVDRVPASPDARILDLCAGGGGKALALAARGPGQVFAHDADPARMRDLPARTARAGARISQITAPEGAAPA